LLEVKRLKQFTNIILVDFHAEATSEKVALGYLLDGKISAVIGSHTHVQTNDAKILPLGSAYVTDVGMTGPEESVIGVDVNTIINSYLYGLPERFIVAKSYNSQINYAIIQIDTITGFATSIQCGKEIIHNDE
jgi:2',3'-cyclic-nucleotide 2'-phosphodiesterase